MPKHPDFYLLRPLFSVTRDGRLIARAKYARKVIVGAEVGGVNTQGYRQVRVFGRQLKTHRVMWLLWTGSWPEHEMDHIDGDKLNNRRENLRDVPRAVNAQNRPSEYHRPRGSAGLRGVHLERRTGRYVASYNNPATKKSTYIGTFDCKHEAHGAAEARRAAEYVGYVDPDVSRKEMSGILRIS